MEPFAVDGRVDLEQMYALLAGQAEYPTLDYKQACDLADKKGRAEFVKDAAAMMSNPAGGYLVVGVDGRGAAVDATLERSVYDSASLKDILAKHLEGEVPVISQHHRTEAGDVVVIYLGRRADRLFPIVRADMTYTDAKGKEVIHLRAGDVFVRDGTSSRRWRTSDLTKLLAPYAEAIRSLEQERFGRVAADLSARQQEANLARGPVSNITWELPDGTFTAAVTEMSRAGDDRGLRLLLLQTTTVGKTLARQAGADTEEFTQLMDLLDRLAACLGVGLVTGDDELVERTTRALHQMYLSIGLDGRLVSGREPRIWLEIAARVLAAIAMAVRLEEWSSVRTLTLRQVGASVFPYQSWLRHADVQATETQQSESITHGRTVPGLLIAVARQRLAGVPALCADLAGASTPPPIGEQPAEHDDAMDSLCQADFLWCVVAASQGRGVHEAFPSFASLFPHRTEPMIERLRTDSELAHAIAPEQTVEELESIVAGILNVARKQDGPWW
jgi:Putative DNA-binding domain